MVSACGCVLVAGAQFFPHVVVRDARRFLPEVLPSQHRLRRSEDFGATIRHGKRVGGRFVVAHILNKSTRTPRVGFVVSKAIGNAVRRNLVKRRLRAGATELLSSLDSIDVVFRALPRSARAQYRDLVTDMKQCLTQAESRRQ